MRAELFSSAFTLVLAGGAALLALPSSVGVQAKSTHDVVQRKVGLLSDRSIDAILAARAHRQIARDLALSDTPGKDGMKRSLRKRGSCPAKSSASSGAGSSGQPANNVAVQSRPSSSKAQPTSSSSSSSSEAPSSSHSSASAAAQSSTSSSSSGSTGSASVLGTVTAFAGVNSNAILSWFRTDSSSDSTNGMSWCQTKYQDDWLCFAPSVGTMLNEFGGDYTKAATAFCGREAIVTDPSNGKSITAFICDGFDDTWVRTPASLDLTVGAFTAIYGSFDNNKDTVVQGATWKFTGNVVQEGTFQGSQ